MEIEKKTLRRIFLGVAGCILLFWLLYQTEQVWKIVKSVGAMLSPFLVGASLAFILNVPMRAIERLLKKINRPGLRRVLAILLTIIAVLLVLAGVFWLLIPQLIETVENLIEAMPGFFNNVIEKFNHFLEKHPELTEMLYEYTDIESINWSGLIEKAVTWLTTGVSSVAEYAFGAIIDLSTGLFNAVLSVVFCVYCLSSKETLARQGRRVVYALLPEKAGDEIIRVLRISNATFSRFISGQCLEAVILGAMFAVTMPIFKMPYIPLVSVTIMVTALVPIVGAFVGCAVGAFFILVQDPMLAVWFVVLFLVLQQIEGNLIYPKVVGSSIGLPGMWVLVAVGVGGDMMGVAGMLLMIPLASVLYSLVREFVNKRLNDHPVDPEKLQIQPMEALYNFKEKRKARKEKRAKRRLLGRRPAPTEEQQEQE